jgi:endonuclease/exonuclease/phosphatase family metal-dependent hydrolase
VKGPAGLRDVYRAHHGFDPERTRDAYSHLSGTAKRRFDHLFASPDLRTASVEYRTDWLHGRLSDHAALIANLSWASGAEA